MPRSLHHPLDHRTSEALTACLQEETSSPWMCGPQGPLSTDTSVAPMLGQRLQPTLQLGPLSPELS